MKTAGRLPEEQIQKTDDATVAKPVEKLDFSNIAGGSINWYNRFEKLFGNTS